MKRIAATVVLLAFAAGAFAQDQAIRDAVSFHEAGNPEKARELIDGAVAHPDTRASALAWYVRGFIYKELFKQAGDTAVRHLHRDVSASSFTTSMGLDTANAFRAENMQNLNFVAATYYNDAVLLVQQGRAGASIPLYERYTAIASAIDSTESYKAKIIEYNLLLGLVYMQRAASDTLRKKEYAAKARACYTEVLKHDPDNFSANYRMGILYYNQAVDIIRDLDYEIEFYILDNMQDTCIVLAKSSLPYMLRAYKLDSGKEDPIKGLMGIYYMLNEKDKYDEYLKRLEEIKGGRKD